MNESLESRDKMKQVTMILKSFERGELPEREVVSRLKDLTGRLIDADWLRNYWRAESVEDFVDRLCAAPIENWQMITDSQAEVLIAEYLGGVSPGRRESIEAAIDRRYNKPSGTLNSLVFHSDLHDPRQILNELKKDTS